MKTPAPYIIEIAPDLHEERPGFYRAFTTESLDAPTRCPVIGYCSAGGTHRTMTRCVAELRRLRLHTGAPVYSHTGRRLATV